MPGLAAPLAVTEPSPDAERNRFTDAATVSAYRLGSLASRLMPSAVAQAAASSLGIGASFASAAKREMIARHLQRVNPKLRGASLRVAVQQAFDSYARYYMESFRLPTLSARTVDRTFTTDGFHHITDALAQGNGCIFALPHLGGWEWAGRWMTDQGYPLTVVVEALEPPELFEWFAKLRQDLGMTVVPTGPKAGPAVLAALRANQIVCLLCDRDLDRNGVPVDFFGERTTLPAGPATLALRTGAPILPVGVYFTQRTNGHHAIVRPPIPLTRLGGLRDDVARITQLLAHELEFLIRRSPEQWHLFQPNWPSDPGY
ncbi:MAG TPA: phosphatidylinositol mannoside acyltransferase [Acidimicrobiaceae bacterium]|nr:phosphatidylinositol mannoside acyltransferase [Acidimicrobiaceae bacterium]